MIVANLATYPPRRENLAPVIDAIAPQVDRLNIVFNQYETLPEEATRAANINPIIPTEDTKDVGKFYPEVTDEDLVFLIDDDMIYPDTYVDFVRDAVAPYAGKGFVAGFHGSLYKRPRLKTLFRPFVERRKVYFFKSRLREAIVVDQVATNAAVLPGSAMPPYAYMRDSQKFVDVRLAKWSHEHGHPHICLAREDHFLDDILFDETIYADFTLKNHAHVTREVKTYAFRTPGRGKPAALLMGGGR
ncbi:MAG: hypothetical protein AAGK98_04705 [Pseudomonadota bacterium]